MNYQQECQAGRDAAAHVLLEAKQTGNLPRFIQKIREAAKDETGFGVGFLWAIGGEAGKRM